MPALFFSYFLILPKAKWAGVQDGLSYLSLRLIKVKTMRMPWSFSYFCEGKQIDMKKLRWLGALMGIAILGITGFQLYWLKQNYDREEKSLAIRSEISFHEAIQKLQVLKLKLQGIGIDTLGGTKKRIFLKEGNDKDIRVMHAPGKEIVSTINIIRSKLKDSLRKRKDINPGMVIAMKKSDTLTDSIRYTTRMTNTSPDDFFQLLYGVDSLQDSLKIEEIT